MLMIFIKHFIKDKTFIISVSLKKRKKRKKEIFIKILIKILNISDIHLRLTRYVK